MVDQCLVPVPVRLSNKETAHGICGELLIRFVDPIDAISMPISISPCVICNDIKAEFDHFRRRVKSHELRKIKANSLLHLAKDRFNSASAMPFDLFSLWAYQSLHRDDAPTTGAEIFHELLTWCDAFDGPDAQTHTDRLIEVSDLLGCRYTSLMLAFGLYTGYRANSEAIHILNCVYSFVILQPNTSSDVLCELNFLERTIFMAGTFRSIRASCSSLSSSDMFPSAIEVALAVESCVQQTVVMSRMPTPGPRALPTRRRPCTKFRRRKRSRTHGKFRRRYQSTPPFPSQPLSSQSMDITTPTGLASLMAFSLAGAGPRPTQTTKPTVPSQTAKRTTGTGTVWTTVPTSAYTKLEAGAASTQKYNAGSSSKQPVPTSSSSNRRPRSLPAHRRRSSHDSSSDEDERRPAAPKRPASHVSSSSSNSDGDDESLSDGDGPPAPKRQRNAGKQPAYSRKANHKSQQQHPPQFRTPSTNGPKGGIPPWNIAPSAVRQSIAASYIMEENALQEQFLSFVSNFHDNVSPSGIQSLGYLRKRHRSLVQRRQWLSDQQRRHQYYRVAAPDNSADPQPDQSLDHHNMPPVQMSGQSSSQPPPQHDHGNTHLHQHLEIRGHDQYQQNTQHLDARHSHEAHHQALIQHLHQHQHQHQHPHPHQSQHQDQHQQLRYHQPQQLHQYHHPQQLHQYHNPQQLQQYRQPQQLHHNRQEQQDRYMPGHSQHDQLHGQTQSRNQQLNESHLIGQPSSSRGPRTGFVPGGAPEHSLAESRQNAQELQRRPPLAIQTGAPPRLPILAPQPRPLLVRLDEERITNAERIPPQTSGPSVASNRRSNEALRPGEASQAGPHQDSHHARNEHHYQNFIKDEEMGGADEENGLARD